MAIDIESLLTPIGEESPCGEDLSYDPTYMELERIAQGTPEQQVGDTVVEAEEPNWRDVRKQATELLGRTRDLRVVVYLGLSLLKTEGVSGLRDGLLLLRNVIEKYWDTVHPQLDPDDDFDPLERVNILSQLSPPPEVYEDPMKFKQRLRETPLCNSKQLGQFSLRDILVARGEMSPGDAATAPPEMSVIEGAFQDSDVEELQATAAAAGEAGEHLGVIDSLITQYVGVGRAPDLGEFQSILKEITGLVNEFLARRGVAGAGIAAGEAAVGAVGGGEAGGGAALSGTISSPEDVIRALDKICDYYSRAEPSSPVPLLVKRPKKLVRKSFVEIIQDMTPDSLRQIEVISGSLEEPPPQAY